MIHFNKIKYIGISTWDGFTKNKMDEFVQGSMSALSGSFGGNPVEFGEDAVRHVYKNLITE